MTLGPILLATLLLPQQPELSFGGDRIAVLPHGALGRRTVGDVTEREPARIWRVRAYCAPQVDIGGQRAELDDEERWFGAFTQNDFKNYKKVSA